MPIPHPTRLDSVRGASRRELALLQAVHLFCGVLLYSRPFILQKTYGSYLVSTINSRNRILSNLLVVMILSPLETEYTH
jgi:hypothetical protein